MSAQRDRVLRALQTAGPTGICQVDFLAPNVCDGGKPITRLAARVMELRQDGHEIVKNGTRHDCAVYQYVGEAADRCRIELGNPFATGGSEPAGLFSPPPVNAIYGDAA